MHQADKKESGATARFKRHIERRVWGDPIERPQRAEIVRRGDVMATVYPADGETLEATHKRAQRMAAAYSAKVVWCEA